VTYSILFPFKELLFKSQGSSVDIVIKLWAGELKNWGSVPDIDKRCFLSSQRLVSLKGPPSLFSRRLRIHRAILPFFPHVFL
jgi:hypothetical protein